MLTWQGLSSRPACVGLLCLLAAAFLSACGGEPMPDPTATPTPGSISTTVPTPTLTPVPTPTPTPIPAPTPVLTSPTPTDDPLVHVPGQFGVSRNSTTTFYNEPTFPCGPSLIPHLRQYLPDILHWTPDSSHLVFSQEGTVWKVDADGTQLQKVLDANPYISEGVVRFLFGFHADSSPDGAQLAYTSCQFPTEYEDPARAQAVIDQDGPEWYERSLYNYEIALTGLEGGNQQRITHNLSLDHYPVWSPDGDRIAFLQGGYSVNIMSPDGSDVQSIVSRTDLLHFKSRVALVPPVWSPDGQRLAFVANEGEVYSRERRTVYTVRPDGSELTKVGEMGASLPYPDELTVAPAWHPDGERLAFTGFDGERLTIHTVRFDGEDLRRVWGDKPDGYAHISQVSWSPNGSEILFVSNGTNDTWAYNGIYVVRPDGSGLRSLDFRGTNILAAWSPDGSRIAIYDAKTNYGYGLISISTVSRDGTDLRVLVEADYDEHRLAQSTQTEATTEPATSTPDPALPKPTATAPGLGQ